MALRRANGIWIFQCSINGRKWCRSTGERDRRRAEAKATEFRDTAELLRRRRGESRRLSQAVVEEIGRIEGDVSPGQAERLMYALKNFVRFAGDVAVERIDAGLIEEFQRRRLRQAARATVDKEVGAVLRMLRRNGVAMRRPVCGPGRATEQRALTAEELRRFFEACPEGRRVLFAVLLATGARPAELIPSPRSAHVALLKDEVDLERGVVTIRSAKGRAGRPGLVRSVVVEAEIAEALRRQIEQTPGRHVFLPWANLPRDFDAILEAAGVAKLDQLGRKVTAHSFRHSFATFMAEAVGGNPFVLQAALGHRQIATTARYTHMAAPSRALPVGSLLGGGVDGWCRILEVEPQKATEVV